MPASAVSATAAPRGVVFPEVGGTRSTSALGRAVVADALRAADPAAAAVAEREKNWRQSYLSHYRRLVEAGLPSRDAALGVATAGLGSLRSRMCYVHADGQETSLDQVFDVAATVEPAESSRLHTVTIVGGGEPERELVLPYRGERLRGDALRRRLDAWVAAGVVEPSCAEAVREVAEHPEWLDLSDRQVVVLGAGAEMGPLAPLLRWGGEVAAVDLPRPALWRRVLEAGHDLAGRLHVPVRAHPAGGHGTPAATGDGTGTGTGSGSDIDIGTNIDIDTVSRLAGADLGCELAEVAAWVRGLAGPLVLGNYVYAHGSTNVAVSAAVDTLTQYLTEVRDDVSLAFLATPTDVFAVPGDAVAHSERIFAGRSLRAKMLNRAVSGGRLLRRAYTPGEDPGIADSLVPQQGPNYALAKRLQRWRAAVARDAGTAVSFKVAPPTRTRSVTSNRALAAAYAGAHRFGVEVFEPATANTLMAALLVHDLRVSSPAQPHPWHDEAHAAAHGGLWRVAYEPRSALGLAALLGFPSTRR